MRPHVFRASILTIGILLMTVAIGRATPSNIVSLAIDPVSAIPVEGVPPTVNPEPATLLLFGLGLTLSAGRVRRWMRNVGRQI